MADIISLNKIDPKADISIIREASLSIKDKVIPNANSLKTHAKIGKGHWILVHDTKKVISFNYMEKGSIYSPHTILYGTEEEMKTQIKNLKLTQQEE